MWLSQIFCIGAEQSRVQCIIQRLLVFIYHQHIFKNDILISFIQNYTQLRVCVRSFQTCWFKVLSLSRKKFFFLARKKMNSIMTIKYSLMGIKLAKKFLTLGRTLIRFYMHAKQKHIGWMCVWVYLFVYVDDKNEMLGNTLMEHIVAIFIGISMVVVRHNMVFIFRFLFAVAHLWNYPTEIGASDLSCEIKPTW